MAGAIKTTSNAPAGIALLVAAVACFAVLDTTTKFISTTVPVLMALWFRYAFQAIATTVAVLPSRGWSLLRTAHPRYQLLRGLLLLGCGRSTLRLAPPLVVDDGDVDTGLAMLDACLGELAEP